MFLQVGCTKILSDPESDQNNFSEKSTKREKMRVMRKDINLEAPLSAEQKIMLENLKSVTPVPDEDCPELTDEQLAQFVRVKETRHKAPNETTLRAFREADRGETASFSSVGELMEDLNN